MDHEKARSHAKLMANALRVFAEAEEVLAVAVRAGQVQKEVDGRLEATEEARIKVAQELENLRATVAEEAHNRKVRTDRAQASERARVEEENRSYAALCASHQREIEAKQEEARVQADKLHEKAVVKEVLLEALSEQIAVAEQKLADFRTSVKGV
jgi:hypothetical protein